MTRMGPASETPEITYFAEKVEASLPPGGTDEPKACLTGAFRPGGRIHSRRLAGRAVGIERPNFSGSPLHGAPPNR